MGAIYSTDDYPAWAAVGGGAFIACLFICMHFGRPGERVAAGIILLALMITAARTWEKV